MRRKIFRITFTAVFASHFPIIVEFIIDYKVRGLGFFRRFARPEKEANEPATKRGRKFLINRKTTRATAEVDWQVLSAELDAVELLLSTCLFLRG